MGRAPCCDKTQVKRGPWSPEEDTALKNYLEKNGTGGNWISLPQKAGLKRCGKSCRLRWLNYLRPNIKHGGFSDEEDTVILTLYRQIGSRWSVIASHLSGRTDNDVKNYWNTKLKKKFFAPASRATGSNPGISNNLINFHPETVAAPIQIPGFMGVDTNYNRGNFQLTRYKEAVSSLSTSSTSIGEPASWEDVVELGSDGLMPFDHLLSGFDFQELNQSLALSPYSSLELEEAHFLHYSNYC